MMKTVWLIDRVQNEASPAANGAAALKNALASHGVQTKSIGYWANTGEDPVIVYGLSDHALIQKLFSDGRIFPKGGSEGVILQNVQAKEKKLLIASGTDERGVMYALFELADRVCCDGPDALNTVENIEEYSAIPVRGADRFITNTNDDVWFLSENFWNDHLQRLARSRINRLTLITGFDTAYMSPPYPFISTIEGFEQVSAKGFDADRRIRLMKMLEHIGELCHKYAIEFVFGIWQQKPWTSSQDSLVENLPSDACEFTEYCSRGISTLLKACPSIDGIQYRVNFEAGVRDDGKTNAANMFWIKLIDAVADVRPMKIDLRAKGLTDELIAHAMEKGLDVMVPTKYYCEVEPMPYHITRLRTEEINDLPGKNSARRYSYDDFLEKPHSYNMMFRIWHFTNCNIFLWGSAENVRREAQSVIDAGAIGITIGEPLTSKGGHEAIQKGAWPLHISNTMRTYDWEDQRYWMTYLCFGRLCYNPESNPEVWKRELRRHFGKAASAMERAYFYASRIMPMIATTHMPVHPTMHYMPELFAGAGLFPQNSLEVSIRKFSYATALPSDEQLFASVEEGVLAKLDNRPLYKYSQLIVRNWYHDLAGQVRAALKEAEEAAADNAELAASKVDFTMLANMADFYSWKITAAYYLCMFEHTADKCLLTQAYAAMRAARENWAKLSALGDQHYARDLVFNIGDGYARCGNWSDRLEKEVDADLMNLRELMMNNGVKPDDSRPLPVFKQIAASPDLRAKIDVPKACPAGKALRVGIYPADASACVSAKVFYRHTNQYTYEYQSMDMQWENGCWQATIPAGYIVPQWDLIVYFAVITVEGDTAILPGIYHPESNAPYYWIHTI